jgi:hypothetical protein
MGRFIEGVLCFIGGGLVFLGIVFVIAGGLENVEAGAVMLIVAFALFGLVYYLNKVRASQPKLISQTFNVKVDGSGKFNERQITCKSCGAPVTDKDVKVVEGGLMVTCPYCGRASALEEEPKW